MSCVWSSIVTPGAWAHGWLLTPWTSRRRWFLFIDNAFAYTAEGVALQVEVLVDDGWVVLTVEDGGPGAPEDAAERGRSGSGSSGLGLSIVRRVVEGAGGTLTLGRPEPSVVVRRPAARPWSAFLNQVLSRCGSG